MIDYNCKVSVFMLAYQHENYIKQALDSVLMQKVNFKYEIVISDDCSKDGTREILKEYKEKYPDKIHLMLNRKNIGPIKNSVQVLKHCWGEYIAILEGDDFWTDDRKLQIQVDFLEQNPEYAACFHCTNVIGNDIKQCNTYKMAKYDINSFDQYFSKIPSIPAASLVMRNIFLENDYYQYFSTKFVGDRILQALILKHGKMKYIDRTMCTYRFITNGNVSYSSQSYFFRLKDYIQALKMQREIAPKQHYATVTTLIIQRHKDVIKAYIAERLYKDALLYWLQDLDMKEKTNIIITTLKNLGK